MKITVKSQIEDDILFVRVEPEPPLPVGSCTVELKNKTQMQAWNEAKEKLHSPDYDENSWSKIAGSIAVNLDELCVACFSELGWRNGNTETSFGIEPADVAAAFGDEAVEGEASNIDPIPDDQDDNKVANTVGTNPDGSPSPESDPANTGDPGPSTEGSAPNTNPETVNPNLSGPSLGESGGSPAEGVTAPVTDPEVKSENDGA